MEPERPLEKLLRAFAKKRREQSGAPTELSAAARQRLHQEISRRHAAQEKPPGFLANLFDVFRPKLVFAICTIAVLCVAGILLLPHTKPRRPETLSAANYGMANRALVPAEQPVPALKSEPPAETAPAAPPAASAPVIAPAEDKNTLADTRTSVSAANSQPPSQSGSATAGHRVILSADDLTVHSETLAKNSTSTNALMAANGAAIPRDTDMLAFKSQSASGSIVASTPLPSTLDPQKDAADRIPQTLVPPAATASSQLWAANEPNTQKKFESENAPASLPAGNAAFYRATNSVNHMFNLASAQYLNRLDTPTRRQHAPETLDAPHPVLASFSVEQSGNTLRMIDADGSVYTGAVQLGWAETAPAATYWDGSKTDGMIPPVTKSRATVPSAQNYSFEVTGTNRALNQNVIFSGNFVPLTNASPFSNSYAFGGSGGGAPPPTPALPASVLLNSRISGKAVIGNKSEVTVDATPAAP